ncbi:MAG: hypothetical protein BWY81_00227 [Firmicutes bacterium ADurb.Bin467]|nr:MAG: hypothetical protein BWY81_00227 [Firmicutes bacterium ADurb.Bin467]
MFEVLLDDEPAPPVAVRSDPEPSPLAERVVHQPVVAAYDLTLRCRDVARLRGEVPRQKLLEVALADEADAGRVLLLGHRQPRRARDLAHLALHKPADREQRPRESALRDHVEKIRLVLVLVRRPQKSVFGPVAADAREVAGREPVRAELLGEVEKRRELDLAVAEHVRVRRAAAPVFVEEAPEHALAVLVCEVDRVVRDLDRIADPAHVRPVPFRRAHTRFVLLLPIVHEHADHVVPLALEHQRRDG